jgi:glycosyltransferase involved in cell wall biosynthesis
MEKAIANTLFGVKTAEYLAAGIPLLVNRHCGGATELVMRTGVGISYDPVTFEGVTTEALEAVLDESVSARAKSVARQYFDYSVNAARYRELYDSVAQAEIRFGTTEVR